MPTATVMELAATLEQLQAQMAEMSKHIEFLEKGNAGVHGPNGAAAVPVHLAAAPPVLSEPRTEPAPAAITEDELLAISAAIGAYLGVRAHIRQIRLVGTSAWAQQGRVSIQASHRLQG
jgi:methylmalonyl-CoA carboxyltransferase large subunit